MAITTDYTWVHGTSSLLNNLFTSGNQFAPAVASNSTGDRYLAGWYDPSNTSQVEGRVLDAGHTPLGSEFTVNNTANAGTTQRDPGVTGLTGGNFVVTYTDYDAGTADIRARLYNPDGSPLGSDFGIQTNVIFDDTDSSVASLSNGGFVVTYTRESGAGSIGIRANVFDANGVNQSTAIIVDSGNQLEDSSVAGLSSGGFVVAWQDNSDASVYFRRYQSDGVAVDTDRVLIDTTGSINDEIRVVGLPDGGFAVAYTDDGWSVSNTEITFRIYNANGTARTNYIMANDSEFGGIEAGFQLRPTITTMGDLIVVGWRDGVTDVSWAQVFDAQGNALGSNSAFGGSVQHHEIAGLAHGQVASVWQSTIPEGIGLGDSMMSNVSQFVRTQAGDGADNTLVAIGDGLHERLFGSGGNDTLIGSKGGDEFFGGTGFDTVSFVTAQAGVTASLVNEAVNTGDAAGDIYIAIENMTGSAFNDTLIGDDTANILKGGGGDDVLIGGGGPGDRIDGGAGNDTAVFSFDFNDHTVYDFGQKIIVRGADGLATLSDIESLQFADTAMTIAQARSDGNPLFDTLYYLSTNADVFDAGVNALAHFNASGQHEGRDPNAFFDTSGYLAVNKDVAAAGMNPLDHYHLSGWQQGRDPSAYFDTTLYLIHNPDVAAAGMDPLEHYLQFGYAEGRHVYDAVGSTIVNGFDAQYYLFHNPDVAAAGVDPLQHYNTFGWHEGRDPSGWFDTSGYLSHYGDVAAAGVNPLEHYNTYGWHEGRDPSAQFDTDGYLAANADVAAAHVNPLQHFLQFGIYEGRTTANDGMFG